MDLNSSFHSEINLGILALTSSIWCTPRSRLESVKLKGKKTRSISLQIVWSTVDGHCFTNRLKMNSSLQKNNSGSTVHTCTHITHHLTSDNLQAWQIGWPLAGQPHTGRCCAHAKIAATATKNARDRWAVTACETGSLVVFAAGFAAVASPGSATHPAT